jgi:alpha,alpha-trehalase
MPDAANLTSGAVINERFDAVAFDLDGVLTKTALVHEAAWKQVFDDCLRRRAEHDNQPFVPFGSDDYRQYVDGRPRLDGIRAFLEARGLTLPEGTKDDPPEEDTVHGLGRRKNAAFLDLLERKVVKSYPHAVPLLRQLRDAGLKTAVVSASRNCAAVLRAAGLTDLFDIRIDGLEQEALGLRGKPAPDTFLAAAERLGVEPSRMVVLEDALAGVAAGRAGGFGLIIGVDRGGDPATL